MSAGQLDVPPLWDTRAPGTYVLILMLPTPASLSIGRLGTCSFPAGHYAYVGSALGGLGPRLRRHLRTEKPRHWHIDSLRAACSLEWIHFILGRDRLECLAAGALLARPDASVPAPRFGASDCHCPAHLVHLPGSPDAPSGWSTWQAPARPCGEAVDLR